MVINQGDIYWIRTTDPTPSEQGAELGYYHHHVGVVQEDLFNHSRIHTVVVCALTTNLNLANEPGNVLLDVGEADLPKPSAVVVSKISSVAKAQLGDYIGTLAPQRVQQILAGIRFQQAAFFNR